MIDKRLVLWWNEPSSRSFVTAKEVVMNLNQELKKEWAMPRLTVYGSIETITQCTDKDFGSTDGFTLQGNPITCAS